MRVWILVAVLALGAAAPAFSQDDVENSKDHPMFSRMPGYYIRNYDAQDFAGLDLDVEPEKHVEGKYWDIEYWIKDGQKKFGPLQIGRNYTDLIVKRGGKKLKEDLNPGGGVTVAQLPVSGRNIWLQLEVSNNGDAYELKIIEEAGMEQKVEFTAAELAAALSSSGSVSLHNILFDTGKATIKPESAGTLAVVGDLLKSDSSLKLEIQGHTDNVGTPAANLRLSQDRAASVKAYLVQTFSVDAARLTTAGFGDTKPVADNKTEDGRSQNRRVELVRK